MKIKIIKTERVLAPTQISLADYTINPYRGCSFKCLYCYAQKNKNIRQKKFKDCLGIKANAPSQLKKELKTKRPKRVLLGSTSECFQEIEKKYQISKQILEILEKKQIPATILTKSADIKNSLNIISRNKKNEIYFTLNLAPQKIIDIFEKNSSPLLARINTLDKIIESKINLRIHIGPYIPYVSNLEKILPILPAKINKINIEIYHNKMGNFFEIISRIEKYFGPKIKQSIENIYSNEKNYYHYTQKLKKDILKIKQKSNINFFYLVPGFNRYYLSSINYHDQLK